MDVVWIGNYLPKAIYFWDCGSNGGHVGAICSKVCEKGDVRTFLVWATANDFIMLPKSPASTLFGEGCLKIVVKTWVEVLYWFISKRLVMGRILFHRTLNELERVHLLVIEIEHLNFGLEWTDIKHRTLKAFTRFIKLFIDQTRTSFFEHWTDLNMFIFL